MLSPLSPFLFLFFLFPFQSVPSVIISFSVLSYCHSSPTLLVPFLFLLPSSCIFLLSPFLLPSVPVTPLPFLHIVHLLPLSPCSVPFLLLLSSSRTRSAALKTPNQITYLESSSQRLSFGCVDSSFFSSSSSSSDFRSIMIVIGDNSSSLTRIHNWRRLCACLSSSSGGSGRQVRSD